MAFDPSSFRSPSPLFSASAIANSPCSSSSTLFWLSLIPYTLIIIVTGFFVFCCCYCFCLNVPSQRRSSRRRFDIEVGFSSRAWPSQVARAVVSTPFQFSGEEPAGKNTECCVCLDEFKNGDLCRMVSTCGHNFHEPCINHWLKMSSHCPLCRVSVRPELRMYRTQTDDRSLV